MKLKETIEVLKTYMEVRRNAFPQNAPDVIREAIDTVVKELEKPTYTAEDIFDFMKWAFTKPGYMRNYANYYRGDTKGFFTPSELLKKWEVWKLAQQRCNGGCCDNGTGYCMFCEKKLI